MNKRLFLRKVLNNEKFLFAFAIILDQVFSNDWYKVDENDEVSDICVMETGTNGWCYALELVCNNFDMQDCIDYYYSLDWIGADEIDSDIAMLLEAIVFDEDGNRINKDGSKKIYVERGVRV